MYGSPFAIIPIRQKKQNKTIFCLLEMLNIEERWDILYIFLFWWR